MKISQWKKIEKRELNGRRLQEVTPPAKVLIILLQSTGKAREAEIYQLSNI